MVDLTRPDEVRGLFGDTRRPMQRTLSETRIGDTSLRQNSARVSLVDMDFYLYDQACRDGPRL